MFGKKCDLQKCTSLTVIMGLLSLGIMTLIAVYATDWKEDNLQWSDEFYTLDEKRWQHEISGSGRNDGEFQYFRRDKRNSYVKNGILRLKATLVGDEVGDDQVRGGLQSLPGCTAEPCTVRGDPDGECILPVYSARLRTREAFSIRRGRVEVRARFPSGDWLRPEIALRHDWNACRDIGELWIAEGCGNKYITVNGRSVGANTVGQGAAQRWSEKASNDSYVARKTRWETTLEDGYFSDDFHIFEAEWRHGRVVFRVDGRKTGELTLPGGGDSFKLGPFSARVPDVLNFWFSPTAMAPSDCEFYLVVKLAVGGSFFEGQLQNLNYPKPWNSSGGHPSTDFYENSAYYVPTWDRPELEIDYVRIYRR